MLLKGLVEETVPGKTHPASSPGYLELSTTGSERTLAGDANNPLTDHALTDPRSHRSVEE